MNNILIIGAHYDDTELGVGGTAALLAKSGKKVYKLTLTDNETDFKQKGIIVNYTSSKIASCKASKELGIEEITDFIPEKCNHLLYSSEIMQKIESIIFEKNIDTVFMHYIHDLNEDHVVASRISMVASRHCKNIFMFQSNGYISENQFHPTVFFNITDFFEAKKRALANYGPEHNRFNKLFEMNLARNFVHGFGCECEYAEGFIPIKMIVNDEDSHSNVSD